MKMTKEKKNKWMKIMKYVFLALVAVFLIRYFYRNYDAYKNLDVRVNWGIFVLAVLLHFVYKMMQASLWHYITVLNDCGIRWRDAVAAYMYSILGKYIPGKVFLLLARIPAYEKEGRSAAKVTVSFFLENICTLLGAAFLFLLSLAFFPNDILKDYKVVTILLIAAFVVCIHPRIINFFLRLLGRLIHRDNLLIPITYPQMLKVVGLFILNWVVLGAGFYILSCSIYPVPVSRALYLSGTFGLSVIIGILSVFAPSGIGVREGIIVLGLSFVMPREYAVIISIVSRLWMTASELVVVFGTWVAERVRKARADSAAG